MNTVVDYVKVSKDDHKWDAIIDVNSLRSFLTKPKEWVSLFTDTQLPAGIPIVIKTGSNPHQAPAVVSARGSITPNGAITQIVGIQVDPSGPSIPHDVSIATHPSLPPTSRWNAVYTNYPTSFSMDIHYRRGTPSSGLVELHIELNDDRQALADFLTAIAYEPTGLGPWLNLQNIVARFENFPNGTSTPLVRTSGSERFASASNGLTLTILTPTDCIPPQVFTACNSDTGTFTGNPQTDPTDIIINAVYVKPYCV